MAVSEVTGLLVGGVISTTSGGGAREKLVDLEMRGRLTSRCAQLMGVTAPTTVGGDGATSIINAGSLMATLSIWSDLRTERDGA